MCHKVSVCPTKKSTAESSGRNYVSSLFLFRMRTSSKNTTIKKIKVVSQIEFGTQGWSTPHYLNGGWTNLVYKILWDMANAPEHVYCTLRKRRLRRKRHVGILPSGLRYFETFLGSYVVSYNKQNVLVRTDWAGSTKSFQFHSSASNRACLAWSRCERDIARETTGRKWT